MNSQNAADVAMAFVTKINEHDVDGLVALMTSDHVFVDALNATFRGADQMRQGWKSYFAMFPDYAIEVIDELDRGNCRGHVWEGARDVCCQRVVGKREFLGNTGSVEGCGEGWACGGVAGLLR